MTERKNGGKTRGRPRRGEGVRGFSREDGIKGVWEIFPPPELVKRRMPCGYADDAGVGLHFINGKMERTDVTDQPRAAY